MEKYGGFKKRMRETDIEIDQTKKYTNAEQERITQKQEIKQTVD